MYLFFSILIFSIIIILFLTKKKNYSNKITEPLIFESITTNNDEINNKIYNISILFNWGYFKVDINQIALTNDKFKIRNFIIKKNKLLVLPNNKSNNLDPLPLEISSTGMLSIDYVGEGTELNFEKINQFGAYHINIKGTKLYLCALSNQNLVFNKRPIQYKNIRIFALLMNNDFINFKDDYPNFNPFIFYLKNFN